MCERRYRTAGNIKYHAFGIDGVHTVVADNLTARPVMFLCPGPHLWAPAYMEGKQAQKGIDEASPAPIENPSKGPYRELTGRYVL